MNETGAVGFTDGFDVLLSPAAAAADGLLPMQWENLGKADEACRAPYRYIVIDAPRLPQRMAADLAGAAVVIAIFWMMTERRIASRVSRFERHFVDSLGIAARALRAGSPLAGAFQLISEEVGEPLGSIFGEIGREQALGLDLQDSIQESGVDKRQRGPEAVCHGRGYPGEQRREPGGTHGYAGVRDAVPHAAAPPSPCAHGADANEQSHSPRFAIPVIHPPEYRRPDVHADVLQGVDRPS